MWGCVRSSSIAYLLAALLSVWAATAAAAGDAPRRVVSINLCTDQLAMLLAADGQLHSVSHIARDPRMVSAMVEEAADHVINHGRAEEIYLMRPDLVLAGPYTSRAPPSMLERLGIPVAVIRPSPTRWPDVRTILLRMGEALHRRRGGPAMMARQFDARLRGCGQEVRAAARRVIYYANGLTSGDSTLAGQILLAAGLRERGGRGGLSRPARNAAGGAGADRARPGDHRAAAIPAARGRKRSWRSSGGAGLRAAPARAVMVDHDWVCGTPHMCCAPSSGWRAAAAR